MKETLALIIRAKTSRLGSIRANIISLMNCIWFENSRRLEGNLLRKLKSCIYFSDTIQVRINKMVKNFLSWDWVRTIKNSTQGRLFFFLCFLFITAYFLLFFLLLYIFWFFELLSHSIFFPSFRSSIIKCYLPIINFSVFKDHHHHMIKIQNYPVSHKLPDWHSTSLNAKVSCSTNTCIFDNSSIYQPPKDIGFIYLLFLLLLSIFSRGSSASGLK